MIAEGFLQKSSYCHPANAECVEAGLFGREVHVADTAQADQRPILKFTREDWQQFISSLK